MFTNPYSIYIDKRPMRIVFLVNPSQDSIEIIDQIISYNRGLWGGRFNPIILTDGNTIEDNWWKFLRDVDPDVIKSFVPLGTELIKNIEQFLSPLQIEDYKENKHSGLGTYVDMRITPASIDMNLLISANPRGWYGDPTIAAFDLNEMYDDIGKNFVIRNFGTYERTYFTHIGRNFTIPILHEDVLSRGKVPQEIHDGFKQNDIPFSDEVFCKDSIQRPGEWVLIDKEKKQRHFVKKMNGNLLIFPETQNFSKEYDKVEKEVFLITDRNSLPDVLLELARSQNMVYRDQICAFPNTERDVEKQAQNRFQVVVGDTIEDIVYFWNKPYLLSRWKRTFMNHLWLPTDLATDADMKDALCAWVNKSSWAEEQNSKTVQFVSFSIEEEELKSIASRFQNKLRWSTNVKCYKDPQIPNFRPEYPLFSLREDPFSDRDSSIEIHRGQSYTNILELTEPNGLSQHDLDGHWMADFYIEFTHDQYGNNDDVIRRMDGNFLLWMYPNRNHLTYPMFDRFSRIRLNRFPSVLMKRGEKVLKLTLTESESVVRSLFYNSNRLVYVDSDPRVQVTTRPYSHANLSDKGKYLQGVLELFGNLTLAYAVFKNPYWRSMFDILSKNTNAEQNMQVSVANKLKKLIDGSEPLTSKNQKAIEALAAQTVNIANNLTIKQKEFPLMAFEREAKEWESKYIERVKSTDNYSENDLIGLRFSSEDIKDSLSQLTERNIIQIGVNPQCPNCGMTNWCHVDDIGQQLICQGCRMPFPLKPELDWQYRLNNLVYAATASHGTIPLILVLGQLLDERRDSFLFSPNLNLYAEQKDTAFNDLDLIAEVDIACIQDGKFIIGEVKKSMSFFKKKDFDDMAEIAKRVKPDIVLFSCIDKQEPTKNITTQVERIKKELCPLEIDVIWYELKYLDGTYHV